MEIMPVSVGRTLAKLSQGLWGVFVGLGALHNAFGCLQFQAQIANAHIPLGLSISMLHSLTSDCPVLYLSLKSILFSYSQVCLHVLD